MEPVDARANRAGRRQYGLATRRQLEAAGVSARTVSRRVRDGRWTERLPSVVNLGTHPPSWHQSLQQLILAAGDGAHASHRTAAFLHGFLDVARPRRLDVVVPRRRHADVKGIRLHTTVALEPDEVTTVHGLPCTSPARTLVDLAAGPPLDELERWSLDLSRRIPGFTAEVRRLTDRRTGLAGRARLLAVLGRLPLDAVRIESPLEVHWIQALMKARLPHPVLQYEIKDTTGQTIKRVDGAWPAKRVAVEVDGAAYHDVPSRRDEDHRVRTRLRGLGWEVVVVRASDLHGDRLRDVVMRLQALLGEAEPGRTTEPA